MFKIAVIAGPAQNYIQKCLASIVAQDYKNWHCQVIIDPVDSSYGLAQRYESDQLRVLRNTESKYALANIIKAFELLNPIDDDILITVDGDDWLASEKSFSILKKYCDDNSDLLVTYGSWIAYPNPNVTTNNGSYTEEHFKYGIRRVSWRASHLRTMKYKVWKHIKDEDFRDQDGNYFRSALDLAIMWPALEMAGHRRSRHIPDILYTYNQETPFNDDKLRLKEQMYFTDYIAAKKPYSYRETF
jgi:glycosyltransferase involved in cell wall biosynthesis